ncbi:hypothetical protein FLK61_24760 [Paenalkalicoccus suaedae]|uniref:Uncharacterized protein n=1 Tax=Paenalkalicoccus suaedae TaxID=2592382 RepID=A0A859F9Z8_9BACI|nr:hypothetical protein [Paenalkalicoccus suaedae]QKS69989.1 hypothetical protein FLK61_24760 [Paenalkalicoccus suaedae]
MDYFRFFRGGSAPLSGCAEFRRGGAKLTDWSAKFSLGRAKMPAVCAKTNGLCAKKGIN